MQLTITQIALKQIDYFLKKGNQGRAISIVSRVVGSYPATKIRYELEYSGRCSANSVFLHFSNIDICIIIDKEDLYALNGAVLHWEDRIFEKGFTFLNMNDS